MRVAAGPVCAHAHAQALCSAASSWKAPNTWAGLKREHKTLPVGRPGRLGAVGARRAMGSPPGPSMVSPAGPCAAPQPHGNESSKKKLQAPNPLSCSQ
jgi:hypothetical protein